jgi:hypothetical protein
MADGDSHVAERIDKATRAAEERKKARSTDGDGKAQLVPAEAKDVAAAQEHTVQARGRGEVQAAPFGFMWFAQAGGLISPWWSRQRDAELRKFWKKPDHLAGAIYTLEARLSTIPLRIIPKDMTIKRHVKQAERMTELLVEEPDFGYGWNEFYEPWLEDFYTQDNGAMGEVIGDGPVDGPIKGPALGLAHLDSWRCQRTGDPEFPIIYTDIDGKRSKLHRSRVMLASSMPSPAAEMFRVGFSAVSRCINIAQNLLDIAHYKQEKLGSRPLRAIGVTSGGLAPKHIQQALRMSAEAADNAGLSRYSGIILVGSDELDDAALDIQDLAGLPDGFDERDATFLGMAVIALAFGVDMRELFPASVTGATRADALLSHMKQRGKGIGHVLGRTQAMIGKWFLPPHLKAVFDYQDDAQDAQRAEIKGKRAITRKTNLETLVTSERVEREWMLREGELTKAQFVELELADGRLEDGTDVLILFHDPDYSSLLDLGVDDPLDTVVNDAEFIIEQIEIQKAEVMKFIATSLNEKKRSQGRDAIAALDALETLYRSSRAPIPPDTGFDDTEGVEDEDEELGPDQTAMVGEETELELDDDDQEDDEDTAVKLLDRIKTFIVKRRS